MVRTNASFSRREGYEFKLCKYDLISHGNTKLTIAHQLKRLSSCKPQAWANGDNRESAIHERGDSTQSWNIVRRQVISFDRYNSLGSEEKRGEEKRSEVKRTNRGRVLIYIPKKEVFQPKRRHSDSHCRIRFGEILPGVLL